MYFTKTNDGFRGWFSLVLPDGTLKTNALTSSFTAVIVNPSDTTSSFVEVTQSQQKQGLYRFDVPNLFLLQNGIGEYGISVEVSESLSPSIVTAFSNVLKVSNEDFNSLSGAIWNVTASLYNTSGSMGFLTNLIDDIKTDTTSLLDDTLLIISGTSYIVNTVDDIENNLNSLVSGTINISTGSIQTIVSGVWAASTASYNVSGTFGHALGNLSLASIADAVWDEDLSVHNLHCSTGLALQGIESRLLEIYQIMGLELGNPLTINQTLRIAAAISQSISGDPATTVTVTRLP